jgi:hypothetical protein
VPSPSEPPVWLLDIDGVVNALAPMTSPLPCWPEPDWVRRVVRAEVPDRGELSFPIQAARPVLEFIARVHTSGTADVRWHSTWKEAARTALAPALGLPTTIEVALAPEWAEAAPMWWKIPAARQVAEAGRRLVWTDDQLDEYRNDALSAPELTALDGWNGALLLSPDPDPGLAAEDLRRIAAFLGMDDPGTMTQRTR